MKGRIKSYGNKWSPVVTIINIQIVPQFKMVRNDLEYSIEQNDIYKIIYVDTDGRVEDVSAWELPEIEIIEE